MAMAPMQVLSLNSCALTTLCKMHAHPRYLNLSMSSARGRAAARVSLVVRTGVLRGWGTFASAQSVRTLHQSGRGKLTCQAEGGFGEMLAKKQQSKQKCPCGGGEDKKPYEDCCKPFHTKTEYPETPVVLMKSRFSAYNKGEVDYIIATTHPDNPATEGSKLDSGKVVSTFKQDVKATCKKVKFLKLDIESDEAGSKEDEAFVTFKAVIQVTGQKGFKQSSFEKEIMREKSRFLKSEDGTKWLYVDGDVKYLDEDESE